MKIFQRLSSLTLTLLLLSALALSAFAHGEPYTYQVTFRAGAQGHFNSGDLEVRGRHYQIDRTDDLITISGLELGDRVRFDNDVVSLDEGSRYYVRGVRLSGRDNSSVDLTSFVVDGDQDYVVAYGISGKTVQYTVNYQDEQGNALRKSRTLYGNVGDKPVVACLYIDGYLPQTYNLTGTLHENGAENVFTFVYRPAAPEEEEANEDREAQNTPDTDRTTETNAGEDNPDTDQTPTGNQTTTDNRQPGENAVTTEEQAEEEIPEIIDIDDAQTPLAGGEQKTQDKAPEIGNEANHLAVIVKVAVALVLLVLIVLCGYWLLKRKKEEKP